jgi:hypothetical protein
LIERTRLQSALEVASAGQTPPTPALLISTSIRPKVEAISPTIRATSASLTISASQERAPFVAWMLLFAIGYFFYGPTPGRPALHAFGGFLPGMLCMYIAMRLYGTLQNSSYVIGVLVACILLFTIGYFRYGSTPGHPALQVFGGFLLGMLSMSIAIRFYGMP